MVINIIGDCDKRAVLYTVLKICQTLGDVLLVSNSSRLMRLSDTKESYGHYQNVMVAITHDGFDDFLDAFEYDTNSFEYTVVDNINLAEADLVIYVEGLVQSEQEADMLEYIEEYKTIPLYKWKLFDANTCYNMEEFESMRTMCPINKKVASEVAKVLAGPLNTDAKTLETIAMTKNPAPDTTGINKQIGKKKKGVGLKWPSK